MTAEQIEFERIERQDVPFWHPVAKPVAEPKGSQWDEALKALSSGSEVAIRVAEPNLRRRNRLKATLQTIAKNRGLNIKVRTHNSLIYAWRTDEIGRFSQPI